MTPALYQTEVPPVKLYPTGQPLTERAGAATVLGLNAYAFEFRAQTGEDVYACHSAETGIQKYALEAVGGIVSSCNCADSMYRRRVCKHQVELAVILQTGLRTPQGKFVGAVIVKPSGPLTVADALRNLREDYHAAAARAVILTAAAVEEAMKPVRPVVSGFDPSDWK